MCGSRASERGFTLLETMMAGGMLVAGVVALMGLQVTAINANRFGNRFAQALMFAEETQARVQGLTWDEIAAFSDATDASQPDKFKPIDPAQTDPAASGAMPAYYEGLTLEGNIVAYNAGTAVYQRIVQVSGEELNPNIAGIDAMRVKITVRFRDNERSARWRSVNIVALRPKQM